MAEDIDLAPHTDDEIVGLLDRVQQELVAGHIERTATLMGGTFTITIDGDMFKVSILLNEAPANPCTPSEQGA